jgi:hypothetical protein
MTATAIIAIGSTFVVGFAAGAIFAAWVIAG